MKIVELILDDNEDLTGIEAISIVENPAIEEDFIALNNEQVIQLAQVDKEKKILLGALLIPNKPIYRKSGGNNSPKRKGLNPPLESLPEIILWGGIISLFIGLISGGVLAFIDVIFAIWSTIALQKSVEFMAGVKPNT